MCSNDRLTDGSCEQHSQARQKKTKMKKKKEIKEKNQHEENTLPNFF